MEDLSNVTNRTSKGIDGNVNKPKTAGAACLEVPRLTSGPPGGRLEQACEVRTANGKELGMLPRAKERQLAGEAVARDAAVRDN